MSVLEKMEDFLEMALKVEDPRSLVFEARKALAQAVVDKQPIDQVKLEQLAIRFGNAMRGQGTYGIMAAFSLIGACEDYLTLGQVFLPDSRIATADGWRHRQDA